MRRVQSKQFNWHNVSLNFAITMQSFRPWLFSVTWNHFFLSNSSESTDKSIPHKTNFQFHIEALPSFNYNRKEHTNRSSESSLKMQNQNYHHWLMQVKRDHYRHLNKRINIFSACKSHNRKASKAKAEHNMYPPSHIWMTIYWLICILQAYTRVKLWMELCR